MSKNLAQLRRIVFRKYDKTAKKWGVALVLEPDDLGQDTQLTFNIAPRMMSRASSLGTTETPIAGTFDALAASITFLADTWLPIGKALNAWQAATWEGATQTDGHIIGGGGENLCTGHDYVDVVMQGVCDNGSSLDVELTRCFPALTDDIELGGSDALEVTLNLNPVAYNANNHADDGHPTYTYRLGTESLETNMRLNAATGEYQPVTATPGA